MWQLQFFFVPVK